MKRFIRYGESTNDESGSAPTRFLSKSGCIGISLARPGGGGGALHSNSPDVDVLIVLYEPQRAKDATQSMPLFKFMKGRGPDACWRERAASGQLLLGNERAEHYSGRGTSSFDAPTASAWKARVSAHV